MYIFVYVCVVSGYIHARHNVYMKVRELLVLSYHLCPREDQAQLACQDWLQVLSLAGPSYDPIRFRSHSINGLRPADTKSVVSGFFFFLIIWNPFLFV